MKMSGVQTHGRRLESRRCLALAMAAMGLLLAGCGGSSSPSAATVSATTTAGAISSAGTGKSTAAATTGPSAAPSSTTTDPAAAPDLGGGSFCDKAKAATAAAASSGASLASGDPTALRKAEQQAVDELHTLSFSAPSQIKAAVTTLSAAEGSLFKALSSANYDYTKLNPTVLSGLGSPAVLAASKMITAYLVTNCGISVPSLSANP